MAGSRCISAVGGALGAGLAEGSSSSIGVLTACTVVEVLSAAGTRQLSGGEAAGEPRGVNTADSPENPQAVPVTHHDYATGYVGGSIGTTRNEKGGTGGTSGHSAAGVEDSASRLTSPSGGRGVLAPNRTIGAAAC